MTSNNAKALELVKKIKGETFGSKLWIESSCVRDWAIRIQELIQLDDTHERIEKVLGIISEIPEASGYGGNSHHEQCDNALSDIKNELEAIAKDVEARVKRAVDERDTLLRECAEWMQRVATNYDVNEGLDPLYDLLTRINETAPPEGGK